jgi:hypothetical protein
MEIEYNHLKKNVIYYLDIIRSRLEVLEMAIILTLEDIILKIK